MGGKGREGKGREVSYVVVAMVGVVCEGVGLCCWASAC